MITPRPTLLLGGLLFLSPAALAQPYTIEWWTVDGGGASALAGGAFSVGGTAGQPDAGPTLSGGSFSLSGGFWAAVGVPPCYVNCDGSTIPPILNVNDFICFQTKYAVGDPYANCDGSTTPPRLNVNDFICFQTRYAAGCP